MLSWIDIVIITSVLLVVYTYLLYPFIIIVLSRFIGIQQSTETLQNYTPSVAILCAMYNEEDVADEKVVNFKALSYPYVRMYIGSDGSSDCTNEILSRYNNDPSISTYVFPRRGKVHVINDLIVAAKADILVFTDANSMFQTDAIQRLVAHFVDPYIGAVCGRLNLVDTDYKSGEGFYWRFETMLKRAESIFKCVVGGNGAIYAVRKELARQLPPNTINDDFTISMRVIQQGYGMTYADDAVATEEAGRNDTVEFTRHVRDAAGHFRAIIHLLPLLNPLYPKRFLFYVSHRVIRWFVPHLMLFLITIPWFTMHSPAARCVLFAEGVFYLLAILGYITKSKNKLIYIPYYFTYINLAILLGFVRNLAGLQKVAWNRTQRV